MTPDEKIPLLVICGPTASGKTALAVELAQRRNGEVISADSMQVYKEMDIGTAKPGREEMAGVPHHLIGVLEPEEPFSVADFVELAGRAIREIRDRSRLPIVAGGTGLYISSLVDNIRFGEQKADPALRHELEDFAAEHGNQALWERLNETDPELAAELHPNNRGRIIRALEVFAVTGVPMSEQQRRSRLEPSPYAPVMLGLEMTSREALYRRIDARVDNMVEQGLVEEARRFWGREGATAAQAIGYKELAPYFRGERSLGEAVDTIKRETRRYAKRQLTWLRRDPRVRWLRTDEYAGICALADAAERIIDDEA